MNSNSLDTNHLTIVPENNGTSEALSTYVAKAMKHYFSHLDKETAACDVYDFLMRQVEPPLLKETLVFCRGNESKASTILGISRGTLRKKLAHYKISSKQTKISSYVFKRGVNDE
jgi:Fis family transcriptional regulator